MASVRQTIFPTSAVALSYRDVEPRTPPCARWRRGHRSGQPQPPPSQRFRLRNLWVHSSMLSRCCRAHLLRRRTHPRRCGHWRVAVDNPPAVPTQRQQFGYHRDLWVSGGAGNEGQFEITQMTLAWPVLTQSSPGSCPTAVLLGELPSLQGSRDGTHDSLDTWCAGCRVSHPGTKSGKPLPMSGSKRPTYTGLSPRRWSSCSLAQLLPPFFTEDRHLQLVHWIGR